MNTAPVKWAQRKDSLYVTITLPDVKDHKVDLTDNKLVFEGVSGDKKYSLNLEFVSKNYFILFDIFFSFNFIFKLFSSKILLLKVLFGMYYHHLFT